MGSNPSLGTMKKEEALAVSKKIKDIQIEETPNGRGLYSGRQQYLVCGRRDPLQGLFAHPVARSRNGPHAEELGES